MAQTTITTNHGTYTGKTVESIIREVYGRRFFPSFMFDSRFGGPKAYIAERSRYDRNAINIVGILKDYEGILEFEQEPSEEMKARAKEFDDAIDDLIRRLEHTDPRKSIGKPETRQIIHDEPIKNIIKEIYRSDYTAIYYEAIDKDFADSHDISPRHRYFTYTIRHDGKEIRQLNFKQQPYGEADGALALSLAINSDAREYIYNAHTADDIIKAFTRYINQYRSGQTTITSFFVPNWHGKSHMSLKIDPAHQSPNPDDVIVEIRLETKTTFKKTVNLKQDTGDLKEICQAITENF